MGLGRGKTEGGSGGKRGHSNMDHWVTTEEIKVFTRKQRRRDSRQIINEELRELEEPGSVTSDAPEAED